MRKQRKSPAKENIRTGTSPETLAQALLDNLYYVQGRKTTPEMIAYWQAWIDKYPIVSLEDGLDENDWQGFVELTATLGQKVQLVGDDLLVTNARFI